MAVNENQRQGPSAFWSAASKRRLVAGSIAGLGAAIAIGVMEFLSAELNYPLAVIPFATSVRLGVLAMFLTGTFHPPAGINPLLAVSAGLPWTFIIAPVLAGTLLLTAFAYVWHRWVRRETWPQRWL